MSTVRKNSTPYNRSSFDAMESTRRLSDGLSAHDKDSASGNVPDGSVNESHQMGDNNNNSTSDGDIGVGTQRTSRHHSVDSRKGSTTSHEGGFTSSSLGSIAKERSSEENIDSAYKDSANIIIEDDCHDDDDNDDVNNADQRSESDSDLDSPDDFGGNDYDQYESYERKGSKRSIESSYRDTLRKNIMEDTHAIREEEGRLDVTNRIIAKSNIITSSDIEHSGNEQSKRESQQSPQLTLGDNHTTVSEISETNNKNDDTERFELYSPKQSSPGDVTSDDGYSKIHDNADVLDDVEKMDEIKDISFGTINKLQQMDRSDPALRRLFMRPRVTPAQTKSVKVDPDIKSMVNEFLKTNVAENFIIARVLRENYALFYAWLASHMQTERNAWAVRLAQALETTEKERKGSLECRNLVIESATRLRTLVSTVSNALYGIEKNVPDEKQNTFRKGPSLRQGQVKGFGSSKGGGGAKPSLSNVANSKSKQHSAQHQQYNSDSDMNGSLEDLSSMLRQSSFNMIEVCEPTSYESDPGTGRHYGVRKRIRNNITNNKTLFSNHAGILTNNAQNSYNFPSSHWPPNKPDTEPMPFGYTVNGVLVEYDDQTNWNQVLTDSIDVLVEICDTFLTDRKACLKLMSSKSSQYQSLVDALSNFIQDNQSRDYFKRKEIEKRLRLLEMENKNMQDEVNILKRTLLDKNEDALNLQTHLNRLEAMVKGQKAETVDKCVGTQREEFMSPRVNLAVGKHGKTLKSKSPNDKQKGDNQKLSKGYKLNKSPYAVADPPVVNGTAPTKHPAHSKQQSNRNGYVSDASESGNDRNGARKDDDTPLGIHRQQSFIEISEEKLEKLKHRAKKLEDSLHEAISSMDTLNRSTPWMDKVRISTQRPSPIAHLQKVKVAGNHYQTAKNIAYWKKSSFEVTGSISNRKRFVGTITKPTTDIQRAAKYSSNPIETDTNLRTENSSLLEGRSIADPHPDNEFNTVSNLKLLTDRSQGLTPRSTASRFDGYHSDDEGRASTRHQISQQNDLSARSEISQKVRARRGQVKQIVSKCLRCQKLFSPTDNHKLACCYHTKDKERLEHYDHMGMLIKVIHAWKCCHQPQEADGCCFGKHV